jgi:hypothetical protein
MAFIYIYIAGCERCRHRTGTGEPTERGQGHAGAAQVAVAASHAGAVQAAAGADRVGKGAELDEPTALAACKHAAG